MKLSIHEVKLEVYRADENDGEGGRYENHEGTVHRLKHEDDLQFTTRVSAMIAELLA